MRPDQPRNRSRLRISFADGVAEWEVSLPPNLRFEIEELECEVREEIRIREQAYRPLAEA